MKSSIYLSNIADINAEVELSIAKLLMRNKDYKDAVHIGVDENNIRCVKLNDTPIRKLHVEDNIKILENLEKILV